MSPGRVMTLNLAGEHGAIPATPNWPQPGSPRAPPSTMATRLAPEIIASEAGSL
ncbi:MAG: hypothetical protein M3Z20_03870 [Chloroflexota bacterium]|nr:hypothetical protein [Chloroflexota bacterium]